MSAAIKNAHPLRLLMLGEVYGKPGRMAVSKLVPVLRTRYAIDLVVANGESAAGGNGLTAATASELFGNGIDVLTSGSRIYDQREMVDFLKNDLETPILRPLNFPPGAPGRSSLICQTAKGPVEILNLNGRVHFNEMDSPFREVDNWLAARYEKRIPVVVDFHAEATSEKVVMGWYLDGRVSAVLGTHTRTPTADARLMKKGTAHISDIGMVGQYNSVGGLEAEIAIKPFISQTMARSKSNRKVNGLLQFNSVLVEIDMEKACAVTIKRIDELIDSLDD